MMTSVMGKLGIKYTVLQLQEHLKRFHFQWMIDFSEPLGQSISAFCVHDQDLSLYNCCHYTTDKSGV